MKNFIIKITFFSIIVALLSLFIGLKLLGLIGMFAFPAGLSVLVNLEKNGVINLFHKKRENHAEE